MTRLQKFDHIHNLLVQVNDLLYELKQYDINRAYSDKQTYEKRKARGQCIARAGCTNKVVPFHTMCSFHLNRAAQASARRDRKKRANDSRIREYAKQTHRTPQEEKR